MKIFKIRWQLLLTILPIAIIPLLIVVFIILRTYFINLEIQHSQINASIINQISTSLDYNFNQYNIYIKDIVMSDFFKKIIKIPEAKSPIAELSSNGLYSNTENNENYLTDWQKILSNIQGDLFIIQFNKKSLMTGQDCLIHSFSKNAIGIDHQKLIYDPLYYIIKKNKKMVFGKLQEGVLTGDKVNQKPVILYPYFENNNELTAAILIVLDNIYIENIYKSIKNINQGTLYILDQFNQTVATNHSYVENEYQPGNNLSNQGIQKPKLPDNSNIPPADSKIIFFSKLKRFINKSATNQNRLEKSKPGNDTSDNTAFISVYKNIDYLTVMNYGDVSQTKIIFYQPINQIHEPIYRFIFNIIFLTACIIVLLIIISLILSKSMTTPITVLSNVARENTKGNFKKASINAKNEIGELAQIFNDMISQIQENQEYLEITIAERTKELKESNDKLKNLDKLKNDFIANITHDFRIPLMIILNTLDLSNSYNISIEEMKKNNQISYNYALKLKVMIDKLLDLSKMDARGVRLHISKINLQSFLTYLTEFYCSAISKMGIELVLKFPDYEIKDFYSDLEKLEQVIDNIISNAIKFVNKTDGKIILEVKEDESFAYIYIKDNGVGIPKNRLNSIFNRFEQIEDVNSANVYKGTGIGLAFAKELMHYLKGDIHAESEGTGKGTTFILQIPKDKSLFNETDFTEKEKSEVNRGEVRKLLEMELMEKYDEDEQNDIEVFITDKNTDNEYNLKKAIILAVDDSRPIRKIIYQYLSLSGYQNIILAADGKQGLDACFKYHPDLIISDFNMPQMTGGVFHDTLTSNPAFSQIPFIFLSAISDKNVIIERKQTGAIAYLQKPLEQNEFLVTIELSLKRYMEYKKTLNTSKIDSLTEIYNRKEFLSKLVEELNKMNNQNLSLIFLDIDHFKQINDTYGHNAGDTILKTISTILKETLRGNDILGRFGGEEFIILLPATSSNQAFFVAQKLHKNIKTKSIDYQGQSIRMTASIGVVSLLENETFICNTLKIKKINDIFGENTNPELDKIKVEDLRQEFYKLFIELADQTMYKAKRTLCLNCGFSSEKESLFPDNTCSKCRSHDIDIGRDRVKIFSSDPN